MERPAPAKPAVLDAAEAFVYIQNDEVRVEILVPLATLEGMAADPAEQPGCSCGRRANRRPAGLEAWFTGQNELKIDGVAVKAKLDRLDFYGIDFKDLAARPDQAACRRDCAGRARS